MLSHKQMLLLFILDDAGKEIVHVPENLPAEAFKGVYADRNRLYSAFSVLQSWGFVSVIQARDDTRKKLYSLTGSGFQLIKLLRVTREA